MVRWVSLDAENVVCRTKQCSQRLKNFVSELKRTFSKGVDFFGSLKFFSRMKLECNLILSSLIPTISKSSLWLALIYKGVKGL